MDLPLCRDAFDAVMTVINKATKMTHLIPCSKAIIAAQVAKLYVRDIVRFHGVPRCIYIDRGSQFVARFWREIWGLMGTTLH